MSQEPKKRHSRQRQGKRRAAINIDIPSTITCANCGNKHIPHIVCPGCGFYKGTQVVAKTRREEPTA